MKYGILTRKKIKLNLDGNDFVNLGDFVQVIATEIIYKELGIKDYIYIDRDSASCYKGEYVVLLYNMYNSFSVKCHDYNKAFPLSDRILPVFFSMQIEDEFIPNKIKRQLIKYEPIGCRDEETMINLRDKGIAAYLSGCITALLPQRKITEMQNKIVFVDVPDELMDYIPEEMKKEAVYLSHIEKITRTFGEEYTTCEEISYFMEKARGLLNYYREKAKLVVTSRLHVASPCMAMGIPVILVRNNYGFDGRYSWIDKFLTLYDSGEYERINWNPQAIKYEEIKDLAKRVLFKELQNRFEANKDIYELSEYYENRERKIYNKITKFALESLDLEESFEYAIWGDVTESHILKKILKKIRPNARLVKVFDMKMTGLFEGIEMQKPDSIKTDNLIYFVVSISAFEDAKRKLSTLNNTYVLADFRKEKWIINKKNNNKS